MRSAAAAAALLLASAASLGQDDAMPADQAAMVAAERDFVRLAAESGFRDSFFHYFAPDGIAFGPHPFRTRVALARQPAVPGPMGAIWAPVTGDISLAGDLGWNAGPVLYQARPERNRPERHGLFFSVWEKQADGSWRVVLDLGSDTPGPAAALDAPYRTAWRPGDRATEPGGDADAGLQAAERGLLADMGAGVGAASLERFAEDARVHRPGLMPITGRRARADWAAGQTQTLTGEVLLARSARSGDLGYTYGSYETAGGAPESGYFARVWKRDPAGVWRIVLDTVSLLPAGVKPLPPPLLAAEELFLAQDWDGAAASYRSWVDAHPDDAFGWHRLGTSQVRMRQLAAAITSLRRAVAVGGGTGADFYNLACAHALSGEPDLALSQIEKAIESGHRDRRQYESDPDLASLHGLQRFQDLMRRL